MSTTPTLRDAAQAVLNNEGALFIDQRLLDDLRAALTQGAGKAVEPVATFVERADGRPVATAVWLNSMPNPDWDLEMLDSAYPQFAPHRLVDLVRAQQLQQAVARARKDEQEIMHGLLRPVVVEAVRSVTGAPDIGGNGKYLVDEIEDVFRAAIRSKGTHD